MAVETNACLSNRYRVSITLNTVIGTLVGNFATQVYGINTIIKVKRSTRKSEGEKQVTW